MISWIALNMVEGLKPVHRGALLNAFGTAEKVFRAGELDLARVPEMKPELAYRISHYDLRSAEEEFAKSERFGFQIICLEDERYPELLKMIPDPPLVLYLQGNLMRDEVTVALVGSRKATPYGLNATSTLARDLGSAGVTIVSGLARGVDARAHNSALQAGARTIAVLGSGLDVIYPSEHRTLAQKIAGQGAVLSEFPLGTPPNRENFPIRNRIISGLCHAVVVVEASNKSGSLITARMAAEQGREVLAVPGSIFNESSKGCNALIRDGAALVRDWKDVAAELPEEVSSRLRKTEEPSPQELSETEQKVVGLLSFDQPKHVDQLAHLVGMKTQDLLGALVSLELKNYITQMPGKHFLRLK
jgi:DNA processing protein